MKQIKELKFQKQRLEAIIYNLAVSQDPSPIKIQKMGFENECNYLKVIEQIFRINSKYATQNNQPRDMLGHFHGQ